MQPDKPEALVLAPIARAGTGAFITTFGFRKTVGTLGGTHRASRPPPPACARGCNRSLSQFSRHGQDGGGEERREHQRGTGEARIRGGGGTVRRLRRRPQSPLARPRVVLRHFELFFRFHFGDVVVSFQWIRVLKVAEFVILFYQLATDYLSLTLNSETLKCGPGATSWPISTLR